MPDDTHDTDPCPPPPDDSIEARVYRMVSARLDASEVRLGSLICEYHAEAVARNERLERRVDALNRENRTLAQRVTELEGDTDTATVALGRLDRKTDTALKELGVTQADLDRAVKGAVRPSQYTAFAAVVAAVAAALKTLIQ